MPRTRKLGIGSGLVLGLFLLVSPCLAAAAPLQAEGGSPSGGSSAFKSLALFERPSSDPQAVRYLEVDPSAGVVTVRFYDDAVLDRPSVVVSVYAGTPNGAAKRTQLRKTADGTTTVAQTSSGGGTFSGDAAATGKVVDGSTATLALPAAEGADAVLWASLAVEGGAERWSPLTPMSSYLQPARQKAPTAAIGWFVVGDAAPTPVAQDGGPTLYTGSDGMAVSFAAAPPKTMDGQPVQDVDTDIAVRPEGPGDRTVQLHITIDEDKGTMQARRKGLDQPVSLDGKAWSVKVGTVGTGTTVRVDKDTLEQLAGTAIGPDTYLTATRRVATGPDQAVEYASVSRALGTKALPDEAAADAGSTGTTTKSTKSSKSTSSGVSKKKLAAGIAAGVVVLAAIGVGVYVVVRRRGAGGGGSDEVGASGGDGAGAADSSGTTDSSSGGSSDSG